MLFLDIFDYLQLNPEEMEGSWKRGDPLMEHFTARNMPAQQHEVQAKLQSILVQHRATVPVSLLAPSILPLEVQAADPNPAPSHDHHHQLLGHQPPALSSQSSVCADLAEEGEELSDFAARFKQWRIRLGFTQRDVSVAISCCQTTISNFENLNLSFKSMRKMKPQLQMWLNSEQRRLILATAFGQRL